MAEDTGQERTEDPTARRKQQSREKGQVATSRELNTMLMMLFAGGGLLMLGPGAAERFAALFRGHLSISRTDIFDVGAMMRLFEQGLLESLYIIFPFFIIMVIAAIAGPLAIGGLNFSAKSMSFKWDKLDPIKGLGRVFAWRGLVELLKALAKFLIIGTVAVVYLSSHANEYIGLGDEPLFQAMGHAGSLLMISFMMIASALILIAAVDVPFQLWDHHRQLKMTMQEVKDENKDTEGNPDVRGRVRRVQREMAQRRMMAEVPNADVIVTNPTHYSVALKYKPTEQPGAPVVVAKGVDIMAMQIRSIAREHDIPVMEAPPLARALHYSTELDQEIPAGLYLAVAQVLAYVFQLKRANKAYTQQTHKMDDLPIPDDLKVDE